MPYPMKTYTLKSLNTYHYKMWLFNHEAYSQIEL